MSNNTIIIKANIISLQYREQYIDSLPDIVYFRKNNEKIIKSQYAQRILLLRKQVYDDIINNPYATVENLNFYIKKIEKKFLFSCCNG